MIIPALDLIEGQVVRLYQGDYGQVTEYKVDPSEQFAIYHNAGANWLHLVDLTGAKDTTARQLPLIEKLIASTPANIQIGGGVRKESDVVELLRAGAKRVVIGSTAVRQPEIVKGGWKSTALNTLCWHWTSTLMKTEIAWLPCPAGKKTLA